MNEPCRLSSSGNSLEARLLRATLNEPAPRGSLGRAAQRLGFSAAFLGSVTAGLANATGIGAVASSKALVASTSLWILAKGVGLGLVVGAVAVGSAHAVFAPSGSTRVPDVRSSTSTPATRIPSGISTPLPSGARVTAAPVALVSGKVENTEAPASPLPGKAAVTEAPASERRDSVVTSTRSTGAVAVSPFRANEESHSVAQQAWPSEQVEPSPDASPLTAPGSVLQREVRVLDHARAVLKSGDAQGALAILDRAQRHEPLRALDREAKLIRTEALAASGRGEEAADLAAELISQGISAAQRERLARWIRQ